MMCTRLNVRFFFFFKKDLIKYKWYKHLYFIRFMLQYYHAAILSVRTFLCRKFIAIIDLQIGRMNVIVPAISSIGFMSNHLLFLQRGLSKEIVKITILVFIIRCTFIRDLILMRQYFILPNDYSFMKKINR